LKDSAKNFYYQIFLRHYRVKSLQFRLFTLHIIFQIFHRKTGLLTVHIHLGAPVAPYPRRLIDDPLPDIFRIMPNLQDLQAAAAVENPLLDTPDMRR